LVATTAFSIQRVHSIPLPVCTIQFAATLPVFRVNDSKTRFVLSLKIIPEFLESFAVLVIAEMLSSKQITEDQSDDRLFFLRSRPGILQSDDAVKH
jgi:hypothetical protein